MFKILDKVNNLQDLKKLDLQQLNLLADDIRSILLKKLSVHGGHFGPNFGFVEATIALHYVFNSPVDKIVYDVSHQAYAHKILTGRKDAFIFEEHYDDVSGYTDPCESPHDFFKIGHTSTSISLASGLAKSRDLNDDNFNVIAVIGDGSLSGGEALEGLDFQGEQTTNFIIVVNDNGMSIAENHGGLYKNLQLLRETEGESPLNLFKAMGLEYLYVKNGNDINCLIEAFKKVKDCHLPTVVHINTLKGKGYDFAEKDKEAWHWTMPFNIETGERIIDSGDNYADLTADFLLEEMKKDNKVCAVVAAVPAAMGFDQQKRKSAGKQFIDVGIAEEHAIALVSGIAAGGGKPVFCTHSSFMQRTYDQLSQDLCINESPATILVNTASVYGLNDITHLGIYDIPFMSNIPNLVYLAPTSKEEYFKMLKWSLHQYKYPVAIRIPCNGVISSNRKPYDDYGNINKYKIEVAGDTVAILALGDFYQMGECVLNELKAKLGINATLINPVYITGVDSETLNRLKTNHLAVITLEDGILDGGFGEKISRFYGASNVRTLNYGIKKAFYDKFDAQELLIENGVHPEKIVNDVEKLLSDLK